MANATLSNLVAPPAAVPATVTAIARGRAAWITLGALCLGHLAVDSCTGIWPVYKTLAGLDLARAGLVATLGGMLGNALQLAFGPLADRGLRRVLLVAGVLASSATLALGLTDRFWLQVLLVLGTSVGSAAFHPSGAGAAGGLSRSRQGLIVAMFLAGGYVGFAFSQPAFTSAYRLDPAAPLAIGLLPIGAAAALWWLTPSGATAPRSRRAQAPFGWRLLTPLFAVQLVASALGQSFMFLLPDLMAARGASPFLVQGGGHAACVLGGALALLPGGYLADRLGARRVLTTINLASGLVLALLLGPGLSPTAAVLLVGLFGAFNGTNTVVIVAEGNRLLPGQASAVSSLLMGLPWCIGALAPWLAGALAEPARGGSPERALAWICVALPLAILAGALVGRRPLEIGAS